MRSHCPPPQETTLLDSMFDVPGSDIVTVVVDGSVVRGEVPATYIRADTGEKDVKKDEAGGEEEEELKLNAGSA